MACLHCRQATTTAHEQSFRRPCAALVKKLHSTQPKSTKRPLAEWQELQNVVAKSYCQCWKAHRLDAYHSRWMLLVRTGWLSPRKASASQVAFKNSRLHFPVPGRRSFLGKFKTAHPGAIRCEVAEWTCKALTQWNRKIKGA